MRHRIELRHCCRENAYRRQMSKSSTVILGVAGAILCWLVAATSYASDKITVRSPAMPCCT